MCIRDRADSRGQGRTGHGQVSGTEQLSSSDHQLSAAARIWNDWCCFIVICWVIAASSHSAIFLPFSGLAVVLIDSIHSNKTRNDWLIGLKFRHPVPLNGRKDICWGRCFHYRFWGWTLVDILVCKFDEDCLCAVDFVLRDPRDDLKEPAPVLLPPHREEIAVLPKPWHKSFVQASNAIRDTLYITHPCMQQLLQLWFASFRSVSVGSVTVAT